MRPFYHEGQVEVEGETLHLVCNFRAIDVIESVTGRTMTDILPELLSGGSSHSLAGKTLWGLLREKHEGVTLDEAAGVAFGPHAAAVGVVISDVFQRAFNLGERAKGQNPPKRRGRSRTTAKNG